MWSFIVLFVLSLSSYLILFFPFVFFISIFWYTLSIIFKRNDIADIAWGANAVIFSLFVWFFTQVSPFSPQGVILLALILWGTRLAWHITKRIHKKSEDPRYFRYRQEWKNSFALKSFLFIFLGQTLLISIIAIAPLYVFLYGESFSWNLLSFLGIALWLFGFFFESLADKQLKTFLTNPENKGMLMTQGLWKYSRHPNYFGEATMWWGIFFITLSFPLGWLALISPLLITFFLLKVTGVPLAERSLESHPDFPAYKKRTSIFFPFPQRK